MHFNFDLKMSNDLESLTSNGNAFQNFGAAQVNDLSPSVALDLKLSYLSNRVSLNVSGYSMTEASEISVTPSKWEPCHARP